MSTQTTELLINGTCTRSETVSKNRSIEGGLKARRASTKDRTLSINCVNVACGH